MKEYNIAISEIAKRDIAEAVDHIKFILKNPKAADDLLDEVEGRIKSLRTMPQIHQVVDDPVLGEFEIRAVLIKNYMAFYQIDESGKSVNIVRFLYQKRDWVSIVASDDKF